MLRVSLVFLIKTFTCSPSLISSLVIAEPINPVDPVTSFFIFDASLYISPTACVAKRCVWAGVDSAWEQEKLEATLRERLGAKHPTRDVHTVLGVFIIQDSPP
jgi:hypothetical protein